MTYYHTEEGYNHLLLLVDKKWLRFYIDGSHKVVRRPGLKNYTQLICPANPRLTAISSAIKLPNLTKNKDFWQNVKKEYLSNGGLYICNSSFIFGLQFRDYYQSIRAMAFQFLCDKRVGEQEYLYNHSSLPLFRTSVYSGELSRKVRHEFLDYCVKTCS